MGASLVRNTDYLGLRNDARFDFLEGDVINSNGRRISRGEFKDYLQYVQIPHSHAGTGRCPPRCALVMRSVVALLVLSISASFP